MINFTLILIGFSLFLFMIYFAFVSIRENEYRAARRAFLLAIILPLPYLITGFYANDDISLFLLGLTSLIFIIMFVPLKTKILRDKDLPVKRIDERDIMFSRNKLIIGTDRFREYYDKHPDKKVPDDKFRAKPGLLNRETKLYDPCSFSAADASFATVEGLHKLVEKDPLTGEPVKTDERDVSTFIK